MNSNKNWLLKIDDAVYKALRKFPLKDQRKIMAAFDDPFFDPYAGDIEKIQGEENVWRRRVGAYRIFYEINQRNLVVHIFWAERRTSHAY